MGLLCMCWTQWNLRLPLLSWFSKTWTKFVMILSPSLFSSLGIISQAWGWAAELKRTFPAIPIFRLVQMGVQFHLNPLISLSLIPSFQPIFIWEAIRHSGTVFLNHLDLSWLFGKKDLKSDQPKRFSLKSSMLLFTFTIFTDYWFSLGLSSRKYFCCRIFCLCQYKATRQNFIESIIMPVI